MTLIEIEIEKETW